MPTQPAIPIREATFGDASIIFTLIRSYPDELVPRSKSDILQSIDRFLVAEIDGAVAGAISWGILPELGSARHPSVEIKSLAVLAEHHNKGIGKDLVNAVIERIEHFRPEQIVTLTFSPDFFRRFGFREVAKETLMHKLYTGCLNCTRYDSPFTCPEVAMARTVEPRPEKENKETP